jgi:hypothetical protein
VLPRKVVLIGLCGAGIVVVADTVAVHARRCPPDVVVLYGRVKMDAELSLDVANLCLQGKRKLLGYAAMRYIDARHPDNVFDTAMLVSYIFMLTDEEKRAIVKALKSNKEEPNESKNI